MKSLWMFLMPLVFLPSFGLGVPTALGLLEVCDYLIVPTIVMTWWAGLRGPRRLAGALGPPLLFFLGWSLLSTLLIRERYGYLTDYQVLVGCSKLGKFGLYSVAGLLASYALFDGRECRRFQWAFLAAGLIVAAALVLFSNQGESLRAGQALDGYKTNNGISVLMAMQLCYFGGQWLTTRGTPRWRTLAPPAMALMAAGFLVSQGRGGWIGGLAGAGYLLYRCRLRSRVVVGLLASVIAIAAAYQVLPAFHNSLDRTIDPDPNYLRESVQIIPGLDDGDRLYIWGLQAIRFTSSPVLGTGFFHRGGSSGLFSAGSHNFFLQIALETGAPGVLAIVVIFATMWRQAGGTAARAEGQEIPVRAALVAAVVGAMSGEYFYGSTPLMGLMLIYSQIGRLPAVAPAGPARHDDWWDDLPAYDEGQGRLLHGSCHESAGILGSEWSDSFPSSR